MPTSPVPLCIYFVPFPSLGDVIPMVDIAKIFAKHNVECTLILTPLNATRFNSAIYHSNLKLLTFQFPYIHGMPAGCESADLVPSLDLLEHFVRAIDLLEQPFRKLISQNPPDAVVSDALLPWATIACAKLNIPHYSFSNTSCFAMSMELSLLSYPCQNNTKSVSDPSLVSDIPDKIYLTKSELAEATHLGTKWKEFFCRSREAEKATDGWIVNSFYELESIYIKHFERETCKPVFAVGPICLSGTSKHDVTERGCGTNLVAESEKLLRWLDGRPSFSVIYVCFGSMSRLSKAQLREIGFGLVDSGIPFIWVVGGDDTSDDVAAEVAIVAGESGQVVKGWAPQLAIVGHMAVGTFMTHCGWGSVMEAVALGRLMLTWPQSEEQFYNEKFVVEVAATGVSMRAEGGEVVLSREIVAERVQWAMGTGAKEARNRAWELGLVARKETLKGGSSYASVECMIEDIRNRREKRTIKQA